MTKDPRDDPHPLQSMCVILAIVLPAALLLFFALSRNVKGTPRGVALTRHFHVGVFEGSLWFHSQPTPYRGGTLWLTEEVSRDTRKKALDFPGVYYRSFRFPSDPVPLWTLRLSLVYPVAASVLFALLWWGQARRAARRK